MRLFTWGWSGSRIQLQASHDISPCSTSKSTGRSKVSSLKWHAWSKSIHMNTSIQTQNGKKKCCYVVWFLLKHTRQAELSWGIEVMVTNDDEGILYKNRQGFNIIIVFTGRNTLAKKLDIWNIWGDSDEFGNKSVHCVQLCRKLLEPRGWCLVRFNLQSLRGLAVWGLDAIGYSDWLCASCSKTFLFSGVLANQCNVWEGRKRRWWTNHLNGDGAELQTNVYITNAKYCIPQMSSQVKQILRQYCVWFVFPNWSCPKTFFF